MKKSIFTGVATAIITPFKNGKVDYEAFGKFLDWQIEKGVDSVVVAGTTGEGSTLTDKEHRDVIKFSVDYVAGRVSVIAGTGSNDAAYAIDLTKYACEVGVDGVLLVTPYYNKTTQKGLVEFFTAIADASTKPCILYDVPSRTGCSLKPETVAILAKHPNVYALKAASGDISEIAKTISLCGDEIDIYSGNDDQIVPVLSLGGKGVISVLSNVAPTDTVEICKAYFRGDVSKAAKLQLDYLPLIESLFSEVNPIPVKAACAAMGFCENSLRLPLTTMDESKEAIMLSIMKDKKII